ncbi:MAG: hypothetical protein AB7G37_18210 [Solirubrobacteraceae bacterium]
MTARTKTLALLTAGATAAGTLGATGALATPDRAPAPGDVPAQHDQVPGKGHGDKQDLKRLAKELDVSKRELRSALREAFPEAGEAAFETFAKELGVNKWQLFQAFQEAKDSLEGGDPATPPTDGEPAPDAPQDDATTPTPGSEGQPDDGTPGDEQPTPPQPDQDQLQRFVKAFADALGVDVSKVTDAFTSAQEAGTEAFVETLADELDRTTGQVEEALEAVKPQPEPGPAPQPEPQPTTPTAPAPAPAD